MVTKFECEKCDNKDPKCARHYDGALGYEAVYCTICGGYFDYAGFHLPDESSSSFICSKKQPIKDNNTYVLFLTEWAHAAYFNEGWKAMVKILRNDVCELQVFTKESTVDEILSAGEGWHYIILDKAEYKKLLKF